MAGARGVDVSPGMMPQNARPTMHHDFGTAFPCNSSMALA